MNDQSPTRRQALQAASAIFGAAVVGCGGGNRDKQAVVDDQPAPPAVPGSGDGTRPSSQGAKVISESTPKANEPALKLTWETIAAGKAGPGPRSRHGLVYDRKTKAAVLFG